MCPREQQEPPGPTRKRRRGKTFAQFYRERIAEELESTRFRKGLGSLIRRLLGDEAFGWTALYREAASLTSHLPEHIAEELYGKLMTLAPLALYFSREPGVEWDTDVLASEFVAGLLRIHAEHPSTRLIGPFWREMLRGHEQPEEIIVRWDAFASEVTAATLKDVASLAAEVRSGKSPATLSMAPVELALQVDTLHGDPLLADDLLRYLSGDHEHGLASKLANELHRLRPDTSRRAWESFLSHFKTAYRIKCGGSSEDVRARFAKVLPSEATASAVISGLWRALKNPPTERR